MTDSSHGYEAASADFIRSRNPSIGEAEVREWAQRLPRGAAVLDIGCGHGIPISQALVDAGLAVHALDASPAMVAAYHARFPDVPVECCPAEDSSFFDRSFDAIVAWGLLFLLPPDTQRAVIHRAAAALSPGGRLLFTAPHQTGEWADLLTGHTSVSLGRDAYLQILADAGLGDVQEFDGAGSNHYYDAARRTSL